MEDLGLSFSPAQLDRFAVYCRLLLDATSRINLTALREPDGIVRGLFLDSLAMIPALPTELRDTTRPARMVDVGSGAGIPGLPLKICFPRWEATLVESIGKKAAFLRETAATLGLDGVRVEARRAEEVGADAAFRDAADLCVARAVAALPTLLEYCGPLVRPGGHVALPKSAGVEDEVTQATAAADALGLQFLGVQPVRRALDAGPEHVVVLYRKVRSTPAGYPRRPGLARTRPLSARSPRPDQAHARQSPPG